MSRTLRLACGAGKGYEQNVDISLPQRAAAIRRGVARLCLLLGWAPLHEVSLPNGRRADILALRPDGDFACIEVKSCQRDFLVDAKWPDYRDYCDALFFAVDADFPLSLIPADTGLIVGDEAGAEIVRPPLIHRLQPARRRSLTQRFAMLGAWRLAAHEDPAGAAVLRVGLRAE